MKIISLQSVGLGACAYVGRSDNMVPTEIYINLGCEYQHESVTVKSIELVDGDELLKHGLDYYRGLYYLVTTSDGHIRVLPEQAYIAEWGNDNEDEETANEND